jgi:hypothetical protein
VHGEPGRQPQRHGLREPNPTAEKESGAHAGGDNSRTSLLEARRARTEAHERWTPAARDPPRRQEFPDAGILVFSAHVEVPEAMELLESGRGVGYLLALMAEGCSKAGSPAGSGTEGTVEKHVRSRIGKLRLPDTLDDHRSRPRGHHVPRGSLAARCNSASMA